MESATSLLLFFDQLKLVQLTGLHHVVAQLRLDALLPTADVGQLAAEDVQRHGHQ
jgi:hypothetical protein